MPKLSEINDKPEDFIRTIYAFAKEPKGFLLIAGSNGNGKTFCAQAIYDSFFVQNPDHKIFTTQTDLNLNWQKDQKDYGCSLYRLGQIVTTKLLILDDLGTRIPSTAFMDFLYIIADKRYTSRNTCGTIITTNLNSKNMREQFGDAFISRVASGKVLRLDSADRRFIDF